MEFQESKPIYLQICDLIIDKVLRKEWQEEQRIPSVREIAINLEVNPNTVMRSYLYLDEKQILYMKRGIGYYIKVNAYQTAKDLKRASFIHYELPPIFRTLHLLNIDFAALKQLYQDFCNQDDRINPSSVL
jgi:GntR family transcriptional regulator